MMMTDLENCIEESQKHNGNLKPSYFATRELMNGFFDSIEIKQFIEPQLKKFCDDLYRNLQDDFETYLFFDASLNLHQRCNELVDHIIEGLLSGDERLLGSYVLNQKYSSGEIIREAIAKFIPQELIDKRTQDLEKENAKLKQELDYYKKRSYL